MPRQMKYSGVEWLGEIPECWNIGNIGQLYSERKEKVSDRDYEPLSVTMKGVLPQLSTAAKTDAHDDRKLVRKGDFAINSRSDRRGSCGISDRDGSVSLINTVLEPRSDMCPDFYNWLFHSSMFSDEFYKWGHGIVDDLWTTSWSEMKRISIPLPSYEEQIKVADFLNSKCSYIDSVIEKTKESIEEYKKLKQAIITEAVTKGVRGERPMKDSGIEWIGDIPSEWCIASIKNFFDVTLGKMVNSSPQNEEDTIENYLCAANIKWNGIDTSINRQMYFSEKEKQLYLLTPGDVLIMEGGSIGTTCIYDGEFAPCYIQNSVHKVTAKLNSDNKYLYYWMFVVQSSGYLDTICNRATIAHYTKEKVQATPMLCVSLAEQREIVLFLDMKCKGIDETIEKKQKFLEQLELYKKSLIYEYVTGKKEVPTS